MAETHTSGWEATFEQEVLNYEIHVYIEDDGDIGRGKEWVDFSDRLEEHGRDLLKQLGTITHTTEDRARLVYSTRSSSVVLHNAPESKGYYFIEAQFFSQPFPDTLETIYGNVAKFALSSSNDFSILYRHRLKITLFMTMRDGSTELGDIGVFLVDGVVITEDSVNLRLVGLAKPFMETAADGVKDGDSWYENRSFSFLIQELLKRTPLAEDGTVPSTWTLPTTVSVDVPGGEKTTSVYGQPPGYDGSEWLERGYICRALLYCDAGNGDRVYMGCDEHLYEYNPTTDTYTELTGVANELMTGYYIRRLWHNTNSGADPIWGIGWLDDTTSRLLSAEIFSIDPTTGTTTSRLSLADLFPGTFCVREGIADSGRAIGQPNGGENICLPMRQALTPIDDPYSMNLSYESGTVEELSSIFEDSGGLTYLYESQVDLKDGYYYGNVASSALGSSIRFSLGQRGCVEYTNTYDYDDGGAGQGGIFYQIYNSGTGKYLLKFYDIEHDIERDVGSVTVIIGANPYELQLTCICENGGTFWVGGMVWIDEDDYKSRSYLYKIRVPTTGIAALLTKLFDSSEDPPSGDDREYASFLDMQYLPDSDKLILSCLHRNNLPTASRHKKYGIYFHDPDAQANLLPPSTFSYLSSEQFLSLSRYTIGDITYEGIYFVLSGSGRLGRIYNGSSWTYEVLDDGFPVVEGDQNQSSNIISKGQETSETEAGWVMGISAPNYYPETQISIPSGKYYMWWYNSSFFAYAELGEFSGVSVWDVLSDFSQACNYQMGFETDGDFFFVPRITSGDASFVFRADGQSSNLWTMEVDLGYDEIYNYARITPYRTHKEVPKGEMRMIQPPSGTFEDTGEIAIERPEFVPYDLHQRDNKTKSLRLVCIEEGTISNAATDPPLFKFLAYQSTIEVLLVTDLGPTDTIVRVASVYGGNEDKNGVHDYFFITAQNKTTGKDVIRQIRSVDSVSTPQGFRIYQNGIEEGFGEEVCSESNKLQAGDLLTVLQYGIGSNNNRTVWSDEGVTAVVNDADSGGVNDLNNLYVRSIDNLDRDVLIAVDCLNLGVFNERRRITSIDISGAFPKITLDTDLSSIPDESGIIRAYFAPNYFDKYFSIGGSNVSIRFIQPSQGTEDDNWTATCYEGDVLDIQCPGLILEEDEHSKQISLDTTSIQKYSKREFPTVDNRFLHRFLAKYMVKNLVTDYKEPKRRVTVRGIFLPYLMFLDSAGAQRIVGVQTRMMFPMAKNHQVSSTIRSITHDGHKRTTTMVLREL